MKEIIQYTHKIDLFLKNQNFVLLPLGSLLMVHLVRCMVVKETWALLEEQSWFREAESEQS